MVTLSKDCFIFLFGLKKKSLVQVSSMFYHTPLRDI